jgi:hypothetical protein
MWKYSSVGDVGPTGPDSLKFLQFAEQADSETARDCDVERKIPPAYFEKRVNIVSPLQNRRGAQRGGWLAPPPIRGLFLVGLQC